MTLAPGSAAVESIKSRLRSRPMPPSFATDLLPIGIALEPVEVFVEARAELLGKHRAGFSNRLRDAVILAHFLLVDAAAQQGHCGIDGLAGAAAAGIGSAAATPLG